MLNVQRVQNDIPNYALNFFDCIFNYGSREAKEMLLYAEREYLNTHFANYDPARQDLWAEYNRPWDFDHIVPRNCVEYKRGDYRDYGYVWLNSIGNIAAISFEVNRSKNDRVDLSEYRGKNLKPLQYEKDEDVTKLENLTYDITYDSKASVQFAQITYNRFCRIYDETYGLFKALFENTVLSDTLQMRKNLMEKIAKYYQDQGKDAIVHFAGTYPDINDYCLKREQDWARAWTGVGIQYKDYMVCFEWNAQMEDGKPQNAEVGIRKSLQSRVSNDKMEWLKPGERPVNEWWYMWERCPSIDIGCLTERMDYYQSIIEDAKSRNI
ncbi:MAG: hypothetical protein LUC91_01305 [Prevotella sp.]|nr:hypothetical protein [Prevotella sp.]